MATDQPLLQEPVPGIKPRTKKWQWAKHQQRWWGKWHLYLGIMAGFVLAIVGVTGSLLVFENEIDRALNPELFKVLEQQQKIAPGDIMPIVRKNYPDLHFDYLFIEDTSVNAAYRLFDFKSEMEYFINPYNGKLSGKRLHESSFMHVVTEIHRTLLIPGVGRYIVGICSLILMILTITGLRLWIPQKWKHLKAVLTVNFKHGFRRQNYDWHNVIGFYSSPVVMLIALTGVCITFSVVVIPLLFILGGQSPQGVAKIIGAKSTYVSGVQTMPVRRAVEIAHTIRPGSRVAGIALPADSTGNYRIDMIGQGLPVSGKREMLILDQYSGKVLLNSDIDFPPVGNAYLSWTVPIHLGSFGGMPTRILALLGGLVPPVLFITGFIIWWPRYKKQKRSKKVARVLPRELPGSIWQYSGMHFKKGFAYAGYSLLIAAVMGALYGLFSGIVIQPAVFSVCFTAIFVVVNFVVALLSFVFNGLILFPFGKGYRPVVKYFMWSVAFLLVFLPVYLLLTRMGWEVF